MEVIHHPEVWDYFSLFRLNFKYSIASRSWIAVKNEGFKSQIRYFFAILQLLRILFNKTCLRGRYGIKRLNNVCIMLFTILLLDYYFKWRYFLIDKQEGNFVIHECLASVLTIKRFRKQTNPFNWKTGHCGFICNTRECK